MTISLRGNARTAARYRILFYNKVNTMTLGMGHPRMTLRDVRQIMSDIAFYLIRNIKSDHSSDKTTIRQKKLSPSDIHLQGIKYSIVRLYDFLPAFEECTVFRRRRSESMLKCLGKLIPECPQSYDKECFRRFKVNLRLAAVGRVPSYCFH